MSKYTTEVRFICEDAAGLDESKGYKSVDTIISAAIPEVFDFDFPIFDESYRNVLCTKILRHYYTREIGFETVGLWKLKLETELNEIMPFYNQLYKSELLKFNPLYDVDLQTTHVGDKNGENNRSSEGHRTEDKNDIGVQNDSRNENASNVKTADSIEAENRRQSNVGDSDSVSFGQNKNSTDRIGDSEKTDVKGNNYNETEGNTHYDLYSDTPQGALTGVDDEEYLTNARKITDSKNKNGKNDTTEIGTEKTSGTEVTTSDSDVVTNERVKNNLDEDSQRSVVGNEKTENSVSGSNQSNTLNIGNVTSNENASATDRYNSTESYLLHVVGKQAGASYSKLLKEFRETFLNIDLEVINSLGDLFFKLW